MQLNTLRSDAIYREIAQAPQTQKEELYRNKLMKPLEFKYSCAGIPLQAQHPGGLDVISAAPMNGGYHPSALNESILTQIEALADNNLWKACEDSIRITLQEFEDHGIKPPVQQYLFTLLLTDPANPMAAFLTDCCGDGGIPGYILGLVIPGKNAITKMPVVLAHETNHNIRWQFMTWNSSVTLADLIISEGLAEYYEATITPTNDILREVTDFWN